MIKGVSYFGTSRSEPRLYGIHDEQDSPFANVFRHAGSAGVSGDAGGRKCRSAWLIEMCVTPEKCARICGS